MACPICERKLIFVTGKGGVGKTTVSAALGLMLARLGKRVLLVELGDVPSLGRIFEQDHYGYLPQEVRPGMWIARITPEESLREYGLMKLKIKTLYNLVFDNPFVKALISLVPGMEELLLIGKIEFMVHGRSKAPDGLPVDVVLVDAPPTGQGAGLLSMPMTILLAVKAGPITRDVQRIQDLLTDSERSGVVVVTLPEEMAVDEALELEQALMGRGLPVCTTVMNRCVPQVFLEEDESTLDDCISKMPAETSRGPVGALLKTAFHITATYRSQQKQISRYRKSGKVRDVALPLIPAHRLGERELSDLALRLREQIESIECTAEPRVGDAL